MPLLPSPISLLNDVWVTTTFFPWSLGEQRSRAVTVSLGNLSLGELSCYTPGALSWTITSLLGKPSTATAELFGGKSFPRSGLKAATFSVTCGIPWLPIARLLFHSSCNAYNSVSQKTKTKSNQTKDKYWQIYAWGREGWKGGTQWILEVWNSVDCWNSRHRLYCLCPKQQTRGGMRGGLYVTIKSPLADNVSMQIQWCWQWTIWWGMDSGEAFGSGEVKSRKSHLPWILLSTPSFF